MRLRQQITIQRTDVADLRKRLDAAHVRIDEAAAKLDEAHTKITRLEQQALTIPGTDAD